MSQKSVAITGASRGIGRTVALKFAKMGYDIAINCHTNEKMLHSLKAEILKYNVKCIEYIGDIGIFDNALNFFNIIQKEFGSLDVLINNAGMSYIGLLQDMTPEEWRNIIQTNLNSVFNCSKLAINMMLSRKSGKIINISSVWGCVGASTEVAYSTTKGGINAFTMALAKELAPSNIQVNAIACGIIDTDMNKFLNEDELNTIVEEIPACRLGTTEEVAELAYQLAESNSYLTAQVIRLDGGWI